jgi:hypothetical protein
MRRRTSGCDEAGPIVATSLVPRRIADLSPSADTTGSAISLQAVSAQRRRLRRARRPLRGKHRRWQWRCKLERDESNNAVNALCE